MAGLAGVRVQVLVQVASTEASRELGKNSNAVAAEVLGDAVDARCSKVAVAGDGGMADPAAGGGDDAA
jgi:hypothetical protein